MVTMDESIKTLVEMGFGASAARAALMRYDNDIERATMFLLEDPDPQPSTQPSPLPTINEQQHPSPQHAPDPRRSPTGNAVASGAWDNVDGDSWGGGGDWGDDGGWGNNRGNGGWEEKLDNLRPPNPFNRSATLPGPSPRRTNSDLDLQRALRQSKKEAGLPLDPEDELDDAVQAGGDDHSKPYWTTTADDGPPPLIPSSSVFESVTPSNSPTPTMVNNGPATSQELVPYNPAASGPVDLTAEERRRLKEDEDVSKALEESILMSAQRSVGAEAAGSRGSGGGVVGVSEWDGGKAEERIRESMDVPVGLRASSPFWAYFPVFLTGLYSNIQLRKAIMDYPALVCEPSIDREKAEKEKMPTTEQLWSDTYRGYFLGKTDPYSPSSDYYTAQVTPRSSDEKLILSLQRLFILMSHTRRRWLSTQDVEQVWGPHIGSNANVGSLGRGGGVGMLVDPGEATKEAYNVLADAWIGCCRGLVEIAVWNREHGDAMTRTIHFRGMSRPAGSLPQENPAVAAQPTPVQDPQQIYASEAGPSTDQAAPAPQPQPQSSVDPNITLPTDVDPAEEEVHCVPLTASHPKSNSTLASLDAQLWASNEIDNSSFVTRFPHVLVFPLRRLSGGEEDWRVRFAGYDETGGAGGNGKVGGEEDEKRPFQALKEFWGDRYFYGNVREIVKRRARLEELAKEREEFNRMKDKITRFEGRHSFDMLKKTIEYFDDIIPLTENDARRTKQEAARLQLKGFMHQLETELGYVDVMLEENKKAHSSIFEEPEFKHLGPFRLCSVLMYDGIPGREHIWSYTRTVSIDEVSGEEKERWFKLADVDVKEVTESQALNDYAGFHLSAGSYFMFYSLDEDCTPRPPVLPPIPQHDESEVAALLKRAALTDNYSFASELPDSIVSSWNLDPLPQWEDDIARPGTPPVESGSQSDTTMTASGSTPATNNPQSSDLVMDSDQGNTST